MLAIQYYDVRITSSEGEIVSRRIDNAKAFSFEYLDNHSNIEFTVNITVFDIKGQNSNSAVIVKTFGMQNEICNKGSCFCIFCSYSIISYVLKSFYYLLQ